VLRAVLDTNILAAGFARLFDPQRSTSVLAAIILAWSGGQFTLVVSEAILAELDRTLRQGYFRRRLSADDAAALLDMVRTDSFLVEPAADVHGSAPHASDDLILGTAVAGHAEYLVTGDYDLRRVGAFRGIQLVSPLTFFDILQADENRSRPIL
jgi:uncharacterized protein